MDINRISLTNFKCFKNTVDIDFGKLTILTGPNSSGKSSLIYSILGILQSSFFPMSCSPNGRLINMGDFKQISHNHNKNNIIGISIELNPSNLKINTSWELEAKSNNFKLCELRIHSDFIDLNIEKKGKHFILDYDYKPNKNPGINFFSSYNINYINLIKSFSLSDDDTSNYKIKNREKDQKTEEIVFEWFRNLTKQKAKNNVKLNKIEDIIHDAQYEEKLSFDSIFNEISKIIKTIGEKLTYISSFRLNPGRINFDLGKINYKLEKYGEGYLDQLLMWDSKEKDKIKELTRILKSMQLVYSIKSKRLDNGRFDILVKTKRNRPYSPIIDVGFGISQFLPIIVADLQLQKESTLIVSQPEIHLHPSAQSKYGEYIVKIGRASCRERV
mgnify:FL=1